MLLEDVLDKIKNSDTYISIDNKDGSLEVFKIIIDMAKERGIEKKIVLGSFHKFDYD